MIRRFLGAAHNGRRQARFGGHGTRRRRLKDCRGYDCFGGRGRTLSVFAVEKIKELLA